MRTADEINARFVEPSKLHEMADLNLSTIGLRLRGAVSRTWAGRRNRLHIEVRDTDYTKTSMVEVVLPMLGSIPARGMQVEVAGRLHLRDKEARIERVWLGRRLHVAGLAWGFSQRLRHVRWKREGARQAVPTGHCHRVYVVTSEGSDAWRDITAARDKLFSALSSFPSKDRWELVPCNLYNVSSIAAALRTLHNRVLPTDLVLAARGGGRWLDHFEDENVVDALVELAALCPTYTAIGHAKDKLMLDGIVHGMFETPSSAIYLLDPMLHEARQGAAHSASAPSPIREHAAQPGVPVPTAGDRPQEPEQPAPAPPAPRLGRADARLAVGALAIVAALGLLVLLIFPARRSAIPVTSAPSAPAASEDRSRAQTDRSAALKPAGKSRVATTAPTRARDVSTGDVPADARSKAAAALQRPAIQPAVPREAPPAVPPPERATEDPEAVAADREALRLVASLIAPFEVGRDLGAAREACAASHGMWSSATSRLPGGCVYGFGLHGGLVQTITLRQGEKTPVPLLSPDRLAALQHLGASGRGPWRVTVTPETLIVQPRPHHPGF
jgi:hypothetical protein